MEFKELYGSIQIRHSVPHFKITLVWIQIVHKKDLDLCLSNNKVNLMYAQITYSVAKIFIFSVTTIINGDFYVSFPLYDYPFELELRKCIMIWMSGKRQKD